MSREEMWNKYNVLGTPVNIYVFSEFLTIVKHYANSAIPRVDQKQKNKLTILFLTDCIGSPSNIACSTTII